MFFFVCSEKLEASRFECAPLPSRSKAPPPPPPTLPSPPLLFFLSQRMNCKSIQVFQRRCRVEEILLRFSRFFVLPPSSQSSPTLPHPPLHLKNPMKPVECCRAFQHLSFFILPSVQLVSPALGSGFQGSFFPAPSRVLSFFLSSLLLLCSLPPHSYCATSNPKLGLTEEESSK